MPLGNFTTEELKQMRGALTGEVPLDSLNRSQLLALRLELTDTEDIVAPRPISESLQPQPPDATVTPAGGVTPQSDTEQIFTELATRRLDILNKAIEKDIEEGRKKAGFIFDKNPDQLPPDVAIALAGAESSLGGLPPAFGGGNTLDLILSLINRGEISPISFSGRTGGAIQAAIAGATGGIIRKQNVPFEDKKLSGAAEIAGAFIPIGRLAKSLFRGVKSEVRATLRGARSAYKARLSGGVKAKISDTGEEILSTAKPLSAPAPARGITREKRFENIARQKERAVKATDILNKKKKIDFAELALRMSEKPAVDAEKNFIVREEREFLTGKVRKDLPFIGTPADARRQGIVGPLIYKSEVDALKSIKPSRAPKSGLFDRIFRKVKSGVSAFEVPIQIHERLGTKELFYKPQKAAEHMELLKVDLDRKQLAQHLKKIDFKLSRKSRERIHIYAVARQKGGLEALAKDGIDVPKLNEKELSVYQFILDSFKDKFEQINKVNRTLGLPPIKKVENYFTFMRNVDDAIEAGIPVNELPSHFLASREKADAIAFSSLKHRSKEALGGLRFDALAAYERYTQNANRYIAQTPVIAKARKLIDDIPLDDAGNTLRKVNPDAYHFLDEWVNFNAGLKPDKTMLDRGLQALMRNRTYFVLAGRARSALTQFTALLPASALIGPKWVIRGLMSQMRGFGRAVIGGQNLAKQAAMSRSRILFGRQFDVAVADMVARSDTKLGKTLGRLLEAKRFIGEKALEPLKLADALTARAVWIGAYEKGVKYLKMTPRAARDFADEVVVKTQGSAARSDISKIQRSTLGKALTQFQTFTINNANFLLRDVLGVGGKSVGAIERARRIVTYALGAAMIDILYEDMLGTHSPVTSPLSFWREYNDQLERGADEGTAVFKGLLESSDDIPVVGSARFEGGPLGAFGAVGTKLSRAAQNPSAKNVLPLLGEAFGVPGGRELQVRLRQLSREKTGSSTGR